MKTYVIVIACFCILMIGMTLGLVTGKEIGRLRYIAVNCTENQHFDQYGFKEVIRICNDAETLERSKVMLEYYDVREVKNTLYLNKIGCTQENYDKQDTSCLDAGGALR